MDNGMITLDADGYFVREGERVVPVGVNYWPATCGVEMWQAWPQDEIARDLDLLAGLGMNAIRFFLRWQDFEPLSGEYGRVAFQRLAWMLNACRQRDIMAHPSLFVGWMSGGLFWPQWKAGRSLYSDPFVVKRAEQFAGETARAIAPFAQSVLAIDLGNELDVLPESWSSPPADVEAWCRRITGAVRRACPGTLIVSGCDHNQVAADSGWRLGGQPGTDFYSMHAYPVPAWNPVAADGLTDPLCQALLPFYTRAARAFGPVMVQEFGTILSRGASQADSYLRAVLDGCWQAGANGFLYWCFRDIRAQAHPYGKNAFEGTLGLVDDTGTVKPGLKYYIEFAARVQKQAGRAPSPHGESVGLYFPKEYYNRENPRNAGNDPRRLTRWLIVADCLLRQLGRSTVVVRGDRPIPDGLQALVIAGAMVNADEARSLENWVQAGGRLIWSGPALANWGAEFARLIGADPVDFRSTRPAAVRCFGQEWTFADYPQGARMEAAPGTAEVIASDSEGIPVVLRNRVGEGIVVCTLPIVEEAIARVADQRELRDRWRTWYEGMLRTVKEDG